MKVSEEPARSRALSDLELDETEFWRHAFAIQGSVTPRVLTNVLFFGLVSALVCFVSALVGHFFHIKMALAILPFEMIGGALGVVLVIRTNSGYERWWEARKLWGGIVNQCRNLAISSLSFGPRDPEWRKRLVSWIAVFPYAAAATLRRSELPLKMAEEFLDSESCHKLSAAEHMPSYVAYALAELLRDARERGQMDGYAFMQADRERALLIDHVGGCERILKTPLALAYSIKIRRFIAMFLLSLPFALLDSLSPWLVPLVTMLVAYPLLSMDQLGAEFQNPFKTKYLSHLPLDDISATIARNVMALQILDADLAARELQSTIAQAKQDVGKQIQRNDTPLFPAG